MLPGASSLAVGADGGGEGRLSDCLDGQGFLGSLVLVSMRGGLVVLVGGRGRQVVGSWIGWWRGSLLVSNQAYGAGRITVALRRSGARVGVKAVAASMRRQGLSAASPSALPA